LDKVIEVQGLKKYYGSLYAVKGIDFYVEKGTLFAFLGPNGAGKTTVINMITTLLTYDEGVIFVDGLRVGTEDASIRKRIGIVFQNHFLDDLLTVKENLTTRGSFYGGTKAEIEDRVRKAMETVQISDLANRPYGKLSGGQRRRADIARALVHRPDILFLDEPTHKQNGVLRNIRQRNRFFDHDLSQSAGGVGYGYPFYDRLDKRRQVPDGDIHPREKADQGTDEG
jgi:multidrug/hemolysin transport system ATP-binding protein